MNPDSEHVYPTTGEHITKGLDCWCSPTYMLPCEDCSDSEVVPGCWKCKDGLIQITRAQAGASGHPIVIVHSR